MRPHDDEFSNSLPKKWVTIGRLIEILENLPPDYGIEPNQVGNFLITDEVRNIGYIEIEEGHGSYYSFDDPSSDDGEENDDR